MDSFYSILSPNSHLCLTSLLHCHWYTNLINLPSSPKGSESTCSQWKAWKVRPGNYYSQSSQIQIWESEQTIGEYSNPSSIHSLECLIEDAGRTTYPTIHPETHRHVYRKLNGAPGTSIKAVVPSNKTRSRSFQIDPSLKSVLHESFHGLPLHFHLEHFSIKWIILRSTHFAKGLD